jgi:hypothetical protein
MRRLNEEITEEENSTVVYNFLSRKMKDLNFLSQSLH